MSYIIGSLFYIYIPVKWVTANYQIVDRNIEELYPK